MSRQRLTTRVARDMESKPGNQVEAKGSGVENDVYEMNNPEHGKNDPDVDEYQKGDPSAWAEDPNMENPAKQDQDREDTGHAPLIDKHAASEAVASVRKLEEKAVRCIIAAQRILPGADDSMIENQASFLMHMPEFALNGTLKNQESLANNISAAAEEVAKEAGGKKDDEEYEEEEKKEAAKKKDEEYEEEEKKEAAKKKDDEDEDKEAAKKKDDEDEDEDKEAAKKEDDEDEDKEAAKKEDDEDEDEDKEAAKKEDDEEEKEAGEDIDLLQNIFADVTASANKKGASTLSGMVKKQASNNNAGSDLSKVWGAPPDVSHHFR